MLAPNITDQNLKTALLRSNVMPYEGRFGNEEPPHTEVRDRLEAFRAELRDMGYVIVKASP